MAHPTPPHPTRAPRLHDRLSLRLCVCWLGAVSPFLRPSRVQIAVLLAEASENQDLRCHEY